MLTEKKLSKFRASLIFESVKRLTRRDVIIGAGVLAALGLLVGVAIETGIKENAKVTLQPTNPLNIIADSKLKLLSDQFRDQYLSGAPIKHSVGYLGPIGVTNATTAAVTTDQNCLAPDYLGANYSIPFDDVLEVTASDRPSLLFGALITNGAVRLIPLDFTAQQAMVEHSCQGYAALANYGFVPKG